MDVPFHRRLGRSIAETSIKFQSDTIIDAPYLMASRLHLGLDGLLFSAQMFGCGRKSLQVNKFMLISLRHQWTEVIYNNTEVIIS